MAVSGVHREDDEIQASIPMNRRRASWADSFTQVMDAVVGGVSALPGVFAGNEAEELLKCLGCGKECRTNFLSSVRQLGANTSSRLIADTASETDFLTPLAKRVKEAVAPPCHCINLQYSHWVRVSCTGNREPFDRPWAAGCHGCAKEEGRRCCPSCGKVFCLECLQGMPIDVLGYCDKQHCCESCAVAYRAMPRLISSSLNAGLQCLLNTVGSLAQLEVKEWSPGEGVPVLKGEVGAALVQEGAPKVWRAGHGSFEDFADTLCQVLQVQHVPRLVKSDVLDQTDQLSYRFVVSIRSGTTDTSRLASDLLRTVLVKLADLKGATEFTSVVITEDPIMQCWQCCQIWDNANTARCVCGEDLVRKGERNLPHHFVRLTLSHYYGRELLEETMLGMKKRPHPTAADLQLWCSVFQQHLQVAIERDVCSRDGHASFCTDTRTCGAVRCSILPFNHSSAPSAAGIPLVFTQ